MTHEKQMPIWYFIGLLLVIYGVLILGAGLYELISPPERPLVLAELHAGVWWGAVVFALGAVYVYLFRPGSEQD